MTWTYSGNPNGSDRDAVRFLIGDTDNDDPLLQDEEIAYILTLETNVNMAAAKACRAIAATFARKATRKNVGDLSIDYSMRQQNYLDLAKKLESDAAIVLARPYCGGISQSDKDNRNADTDRVTPAFTKNQMDNKAAWPPASPLGDDS